MIYKLAPALLFFVLISAPASAEEQPNIHLRSGLPHSNAVFTQTKRGHVAFIGGSITQMDGYRPMVVDALKKRFADTKFTFTDAGLASTCSTSGAFRLASQVLKHGPVDLLYVEFAVNDDQDAGHDRSACIRGMEGIIRHVRQHNPNADIVATYFVNPHLMGEYRKGSVATSIAAHEEVTQHYQVPVVNLAKEIQEQIDAEKMTWAQFGGVHPKPTGNRHCANMHEQLMVMAWDRPIKPANRPLPAPLDPTNYERGTWVEPASATYDAGWTVEVPDWKSIKGSFRKDYAGKPFLVSKIPGAIAHLAFTGNAVGAFVLAGPDAGTLECRIDEGEWTAVPLFHRHSNGLHYPRSVMFATGLKDGPHQLQIRLAASPNSKGSGPAVRIMYFAVN